VFLLRLKVCATKCKGKTVKGRSRRQKAAQLSTANILIEYLMLRDNLLSLYVDFFWARIF